MYGAVCLSQRASVCAEVVWDRGHAAAAAGGYDLDGQFAPDGDALYAGTDRHGVLHAADGAGGELEKLLVLCRGLSGGAAAEGEHCAIPGACAYLFAAAAL